LATVWCKNCDDMLSRFHLIPERHGRTDRQTDRRTDGQNFYINIARQCADAREKSRFSTNIGIYLGTDAR